MTRAGVAGGLAVGGVVALVVAWVLGDDFSPAEILLAEPNSGWVRVATVVVVVLLVGVVWLRWRYPGDPAIRWGTIGAAVVAVVLAGLAGWGFGGQFYRGFPGQATLLATLGGLAVTTGALVGLRVTGRWRVLPAAGAFLLVPVVATPLVLVAPDLRVDATTTSPAEATSAGPAPATVPRPSRSKPVRMARPCWCSTGLATGSSCTGRSSTPRSPRTARSWPCAPQRDRAPRPKRTRRFSTPRTARPFPRRCRTSSDRRARHSCPCPTPRASWSTWRTARRCRAPRRSGRACGPGSAPFSRRAPSVWTRGRDVRPDGRQWTDRRGRGRVHRREARPGAGHLGGPFIETVYGYAEDEVQFVAAPGAVVVFPWVPPVDGGRAQVVGLR